MLFRSVVYFSHGDKYSKTNMPSLKTGDVLMYGHYHINEVANIDGVLAVNLASASLPKNGTESAYAVIDADNLRILSFSGSEIYKYCF